jgi:hypothetical protein
MRMYQEKEKRKKKKDSNLSLMVVFSNPGNYLFELRRLPMGMPSIKKKEIEKM